MKSLWHPATAISLVALFLGGTGGALAAREGLIPGSQIKPHSIPLSALMPAAVASLRGRVGPHGPAGIDGTNGTNGTLDPSKVTRLVGDPVSVAPNSVGTASVQCAAGQIAIGGGGIGGIAGIGSMLPLVNATGTPLGWAVVVSNLTTVTVSAQAIAVCAAP
jgi:hypothetical protein